MSYENISRRRLLAASGVIAVGGLAGCLGRAASMATNTGAAPAAAFAGSGESELYPSRHSNTYRLSPVVRVDEGPLAGDIELEAWVTGQATMEDYNSPQSDRSTVESDDDDSDGDGVGDEADVLETALELENQLLSQTTAAADSISKRSARTGRSQLADMERTIQDVQATLERCGGDVCRTVLENADHRTKLVQQAQSNVENGEWAEAAAAVEAVRGIVEGDIERLEEAVSSANPLYQSGTVEGQSAIYQGESIAPPDGPLSSAEREALVEYFSESPVVGERFTVCLPDAELPGGNGSLAEEVTPQRFIDYMTGRAASGDDGKVYSWGDRPKAASGNGGGDCDDAGSSIRPGDVCRPSHLESAVSAPIETGGSLEATRTSDATVTVINDPPRAEGGVSVLVCPVNGAPYEPSDLSEWGPESGASAETPTIVCQVLVQPPECPHPFPALLYLKRCRSDEQLVYTGGWIIDTAALYERCVTMLTIAGETQVVGIDVGGFDGDADGFTDVLSRSLSSERARRGARLESGSVAALVESGVLSDGDTEQVDHLLRLSSGRAEGDEDAGEVFVTHCPLDCPVLHLVNAGSASDEVKFKAGAELSKSVN